MELWKIAGLVIAALASVTGILGALYGIVTVPMLRTVKAELSSSESRLEIRLMELEKNLKLEMAGIKLEMAAMEKRLNERIDTRLVHR